ncbi:unnamed protein product [Amoebophrya sp. A25]|nr:unnamed protein product [Amoebophrya sp. A25]|eukprot:GSA25T00013693001.1
MSCAIGSMVWAQDTSQAWHLATVQDTLTPGPILVLNWSHNNLCADVASASSSFQASGCQRPLNQAWPNMGGRNLQISCLTIAGGDSSERDRNSDDSDSLLALDEGAIVGFVLVVAAFMFLVGIYYVNKNHPDALARYMPSSPLSGGTDDGPAGFRWVTTPKRAIVNMFSPKGRRPAPKRDEPPRDSKSTLLSTSGEGKPRPIANTSHDKVAPEQARSGSGSVVLAVDDGTSRSGSKNRTQASQNAQGGVPSFGTGAEEDADDSASARGAKRSGSQINGAGERVYKMSDAERAKLESYVASNLGPLKSHVDTTPRRSRDVSPRTGSVTPPRAAGNVTPPRVPSRNTTPRTTPRKTTPRTTTLTLDTSDATLSHAPA